MKQIAVVAVVMASACIVEDPARDDAPACSGGKCDADGVDDGRLHAKKLAAGGSHTCAITDDGNLRCWGTNAFGETGSRFAFGRGEFGAVPVAKLPGPALEVVAGDDVTCAYIVASDLPASLDFEDDGVVPRPPANATSGVYCFGFTGGMPTANWLFRLPDADWVPNLLAGAGTMHFAGGLHSPFNAPALTAMAIDGVGRSCFANADGVACYDAVGQTVLAPFAGTKTREHCETTGGEQRCASIVVPEIEIARIAKSLTHSCVLTKSGELWCWGENRHGALGNGTTDSVAVPTRTPLPGDREVIDVTVGIEFTCATTRDGVYCAGTNTFQQLGADRDDLYSTTFVPVAGLPGVPSKLVSWVSRTCALVDKRVWCWGADAWDITGRRRAVPGPELAGPAHDLAIGVDHACAATIHGVQCWGGFNGNGELGRRDIMVDIDNPQPLWVLPEPQPLDI